MVFNALTLSVYSMFLMQIAMYFSFVYCRYNNDNDEILGVMIGGYARESDNLPFTSTVLLDRKNFYKMKAAGTAGDYILQHLIQTVCTSKIKTAFSNHCLILELHSIQYHCLLMLQLGGYQVWSTKGLADRSAPCSYKGKKAKEEFQKITNCSANIPLEQNSLPFAPDYNEFDCLFWDPYVVTNRIIVFFKSNHTNHIYLQHSFY